MTTTALENYGSAGRRMSRQHLWTEMAYIKTQYALPGVSWIVMDDFNETLVSSKHSRGTISNANLRAKILDRVLVNDHWLDHFPHSYASVEPSGVSDHTRCWVRLETPPPGNKRPFKFFNFLVDHPDFHDTIATVWDSTEEALLSPTETTFDEAAEAMTVWNHWAGIEESFLRQKSRITLLKNGDQNTLFFFKIVQTRTSFNMIRRLTLPSGEVITDLQRIIVVAAAEFYRASWDIIKQDFVTAVQSFFMYGFLPRGVNTTILTLIPKHGDAKEIKDYRPISCCNILYKVISKILANRLKVLLPKLIEPTQCAFVKGRLLLENVLLATELVKDYHKQSIQPRSVLNLDISKAFDSVNWSFITNTLRTMGIPDMLVHWIHTCLSTAAFFVSVNGELEGFFGSERGLRQGCSLSPYLFVIAINVLSRMLNKAAQSHSIGYHPSCSKVNLTHLSFADDLMIFTDGAAASLKGVFEVLSEFASISGLLINPAKFSIFMAGRISQDFKDEVQRLGIPTESLPVRYLGLPLTTKTMTKTDYEPLIYQIRTCLVSWSSRSLSYAGRLQLVKTVIGSITNFWCSVFRLPKSCLSTIESMCAAFLWSGSPNTHTKAKVAWDDVCRPKDEGGLGLSRLTEISRVFALSLIWRLLTNSGSLWVAWTKDRAASFLRSEIGNGETTLFWFDNWLSVGRLLNITGDLGTQVLGIPRYATVSEAASGGQWNIRRCRGYHLRAMMAYINPVPAPAEDAADDRRLWHHGDGVYKPAFCSKATWEQLRTHYPKIAWSKVVWFQQSIPRFAFITWLAFQGRLSTGARSRAWGCIQPCLLCGEPDETRDHLYFACPYSFTVWIDLVGFMLRSRVNSDWAITVTSLLSPRRKEIDTCLLKLALQASIYSIWRERNSKRHNGNSLSASQMVRYIDKTNRNRISSLRHRKPAFYSDMMQRWLARNT
ncbi:PREDICTED: uncharacterized protein LOC106309022 [Brassica oleracea var. oleracea]|uniref:uncharacterized protein LOC106309022 n=1 Tax=Brassica oleracea var. oleracea TaxID=109376 RepID=UPI0006A72E53|nr:PREDICTED: uncharacterized protein LOC106309022 [Brassica oleracea var. oleracea]